MQLSENTIEVDIDGTKHVIKEEFTGMLDDSRETFHYEVNDWTI